MASHYRSKLPFALHREHPLAHTFADVYKQRRGKRRFGGEIGQTAEVLQIRGFLDLLHRLFIRMILLVSDAHRSNAPAIQPGMSVRLSVSNSSALRPARMAPTTLALTLSFPKYQRADRAKPGRFPAR